MKYLGIVFLSLSLAFVSMGGSPASAKTNSHKGAGIDKVIGACKRTAGCWYDSFGPGKGMGCTADGKTCFLCSNSKCVQVIKGHATGTTLGGVRLPAGGAHPASGGDSTGGNSKPTKYPGSAVTSNPPTSVKSPTGAGKEGGMGGGMSQGHNHLRPHPMTPG